MAAPKQIIRKKQNRGPRNYYTVIFYDILERHLSLLLDPHIVTGLSQSNVGARGGDWLHFHAWNCGL